MGLSVGSVLLVAWLVSLAGGQSTYAAFGEHLHAWYGQVLLLGCWPDRPGSLGHFLYTKTEPKSDRLLQSVVLLWAAPAGSTEIPWVEPVTPPSNLRKVAPSELGVGTP